jgi:ankyrin repeat protein
MSSSIHTDSITMAPPKLPPELLLNIADNINISDDRHELRYNDFNSFLQANCALYDSLNNKLWIEAAKNNDDRTPLILTQLINTDNLPRLKFFLDSGANVDARLPAFHITGIYSDEFPLKDMALTPLLHAVHSGNLELASLLLKKGAKVEYPGQFSPLHAAHSAEMVQLLLDHNAHPEWEDEIHHRPVLWYVRRNEFDALRTILQRGVWLNGFGRGPLHEAALRNLAAVELLLKHGANVRETDSDWNTPLHMAAQAGKTDVVKVLVERWPQGVKARDKFGRTPFLLAAKNGTMEMAKFLVEQWPEGIAVGDHYSETPLHWAALMGEIDMVRFLVEQWREGMMQRDKCKMTPLHLAAAEGKTDVVRYLVGQWPEGMRERDSSRKTPLQLAVKAGKKDVVRLLLWQRWWLW